MSGTKMHYDGCEIKHISLSSSFACFIPLNDPKAVFMFEVQELFIQNEMKLLSKINPIRACCEPYDVQFVMNHELGNIAYIVTYDSFHLRVRRSQLITKGNIKFRYFQF